jgi:hypothetical protein
MYSILTLSAATSETAARRVVSMNVGGLCRA